MIEERIKERKRYQVREYEIEITEVLCKSFFVLANSEHEAKEIVEKNYFDKVYTLNENDFYEVGFNTLNPYEDEREQNTAPFHWPPEDDEDDDYNYGD